MNKFKNQGEQTAFNVVCSTIGKRNLKFIESNGLTKRLTYCIDNWKQKNKGEFFVYAEGGTGQNYLTEKGNNRYIEMLIIAPNGKLTFIDAKHWGASSVDFLNKISVDIMEASNINGNVLFSFTNDVTCTKGFTALNRFTIMPNNVTITDGKKELKQELKRLLF